MRQTASGQGWTRVEWKTGTHWAALGLTAALPCAEHPRWWVEVMQMRGPHSCGYAGALAEARTLCLGPAASSRLSWSNEGRRCSQGG